MPKENFHRLGAIEGDKPDLVVTWGDEQNHVEVNGCTLDRSGINRLIDVLQIARDRQYGRDARPTESDLGRLLRKAEEAADADQVHRALALIAIAEIQKQRAELDLA